MPWKEIEDAKVRHLWLPQQYMAASSTESDYTAVEPGFYETSGIPFDPETEAELVYIKTEIFTPDLPEGEQSPAERVLAAIGIAIEYGGRDGAHHKDWVIDQMVRVLAGRNYEQIVTDACADGGEWNEGVAP